MFSSQFKTKDYISCPNNELMSGQKQRVFVQQEQVSLDWPEVYVYGAEQNGGQYGAQQHQGPTAVYNEGYWAPNNVGLPPVTDLMDDEYCPSTTTTIPNLALKLTDYLNCTLATASAMTYDAFPVFAPESNTAPTFGGQNGNDLVTPVQTVPPVKVPVIKKAKKPRKKKEAVGSYVKKPLNSFMLFLKHNRKSAEEELGVRMSATVNKFLSGRWKSLSAEEKAKYIAEAEANSILHLLENPGWSFKINYSVKRKRSRALT
ncbi:transcription factor 7-like 1 isoform X2 [Gouania willdenowi]|uniref:transcription factor 7-like 1 isoform X2 n=1 Tax=Gouania willdenowi TaxID=441366 RepID=UPI001054D9ED|nr:transcription factor 7-like 1 isoform X2 [Gouania willdenowi]